MASGSNQDLSNSSLYCGPHQPRTFNFPFRIFGNESITKRSFLPKWFDTFTWLDYDESNDCVYCYICRLALSKKKLKLPQRDLSFTHLGFTNWKDSTVGFRSHEKSKSHINAVEVMMVTHSNTTLDIGRMLSANYEEERKVNREMLLLILKNIRFLGRQGLSLRGDGDEVNSNLFNY